MKRHLLGVFGVALGLGACSTSDPSHQPVARIQLAPLYIPEHDAFVTVVTLSGKTSADPFDDPSGAKKLEYHWELPPGARVMTGALDGTVDKSDLTLRLPGDRPAEITLTVTDSTGESAHTTAIVGLIK